MSNLDRESASDSQQERIEVISETIPAQKGGVLLRKRLVEGAYYLWQMRIVELIAVQSQSQVLVRERESSEVHTLDPTNLQPFALSDLNTSKANTTPLGVTAAQWDEARRRQTIIAALAKEPRMTRAGLHRAAGNSRSPADKPIGSFASIVELAAWIVYCRVGLA